MHKIIVGILALLFFKINTSAIPINTIQKLICENVIIKFVFSSVSKVFQHASASEYYIVVYIVGYFDLREDT